MGLYILVLLLRLGALECQSWLAAERDLNQKTTQLQLWCKKIHFGGAGWFLTKFSTSLKHNMVVQAIIVTMLLCYQQIKYFWNHHKYKTINSTISSIFKLNEILVLWMDILSNIFSHCGVDKDCLGELDRHWTGRLVNY